MKSPWGIAYSLAGIAAGSHFADWKWINQYTYCSPKWVAGYLSKENALVFGRMENVVDGRCGMGLVINGNRRFIITREIRL